MLALWTIWLVGPHVHLASHVWIKHQIETPWGAATYTLETGLALAASEGPLAVLG